MDPRLLLDQARATLRPSWQSVAARAAFQPDAWQRKVLDSQSKRLLLNCSRQSGKSTCAALLAWVEVLSDPKAMVLIISPSMNQSRELFIKVEKILAEMRPAPELAEHTKHSLMLASGARIVSLPSNETTARGYSAVTLLLVDEAAFVSEDLIAAVTPMLATTDGRMIMMSTPNGMTGLFYDEWQRGAWEQHTVTAADSPRISKTFLESERARLGAKYEQEFCCQFIAAATGRVLREYDPRAHDTTTYPTGVWSYVLGIDFGVVDQNAFTVIGWRAHDPTAYIFESYRKTGLVDDIAVEIRALERRYRGGFQVMVGDLGGMGKLHAAELARRARIYVSPAEKQTKLSAINLLNAAFAAGRVRVLNAACPDLVDEMFKVAWAKGGEKVADGQTDHALHSFLYAWRAACAYLEQPQPEEPAKDTPAAWKLEEERAITRRIEQLAREHATDWTDNIGGAMTNGDDWRTEF